MDEESLEVMGLKDCSEHYERQFWYYVKRYRRLLSIVGSLMNDLPTNKDWLDPSIEKEINEILKAGSI